jgi:hypothetical protein
MKNAAFLKFLRSISFFAIILIILSLLLFSFIIPQFYLGIFPFLFFLFFSVNSAFAYLMEISAKKRNMVVIRTFLLGWTIKFFVYVIFLIIYVLLNRVNAINFLVQFTSLYIAFSGFEIAYMIRNFKKPDDQGKI